MQWKLCSISWFTVIQADILKINYLFKQPIFPNLETSTCLRAFKRWFKSTTTTKLIATISMSTPENNLLYRNLQVSETHLVVFHLEEAA